MQEKLEKLCFFQNRNSLTWFTVCNSMNDQNTEICLAGLKNKRLYYDVYHDIFMVLDSNNKNDSCHFALNLNSNENLETSSNDKVSISCGSRGNLHLTHDRIGFGTGTMLQMSE